MIRVDYLNETDRISPFFPKLLRMKKFKLAFPGTCDVDEKGIQIFSSYLRKCQSLRELKVWLEYMSCISQDGYSAFSRILGKIRKLEILKLRTLTFYTSKKQPKDFDPKFPKMPRLKEYHCKKGAKTGWTAMTAGIGEFLPSYIYSYPYAFDPVVMNSEFVKYVVSTEAALAFNSVLPHFKSLKLLKLVFVSCNLTDLEVMILAEGIGKCKQIEEATFTVIQKPEISWECYCKAAEFISKLNNLKKFDIYFRRLNVSSFEVKQIKTALEKLNNTKYILQNQSLHIYRNPNLMLEEQ